MDSISRHEQLLRVFHLIDILSSARRPLSIAEIKRQLQDRGVETARKILDRHALPPSSGRRAGRLELATGRTSNRT